jgi:hypothetical protein
MPSNCERCGSPLIQIEHCGARGDRAALHAIDGKGTKPRLFVVELELEDWQALGKLANSAKWTLRHKKTLGDLSFQGLF